MIKCKKNMSEDEIDMINELLFQFDQLMRCVLYERSDANERSLLNIVADINSIKDDIEEERKS